MRNLILQLLFLFLVGSCAFAKDQDTIYFDAKDNYVSSLSLADHYTVTSVDKSDTTIVYWKTFDVVTHHLLGERQFYRFNKKMFRNGVERTWYKSGLLEREVNYKINELDGQEKAYWENGKLRRETVYKSGMLISGKCYAQNGTDTTFYPHEKQPSFDGGEKALHEFLSNDLTYPREPRRQHIRGKTICQYFVTEDGSIDDVKVIKSSGNIRLDNEVIRVIFDMPRWKPGYIEGKTARVRYVLPVCF